MIIKVYIGVIGAGKDFMAKKECDISLAFADALREEVWEMLGWRPKTLSEYEDFKKQGWKLPGRQVSYFTGRDILQRYGTDIRRKEDPNHWVKKLIEKLNHMRTMDIPMYIGDKRPSSYIVGISDCRFENEVRGLIEFSTQESVSLEFVHTNYKSERYNNTSKHKSEEFSQQFLEFKGSQEEFNKLIWSKYGI